MNRTLTRMAFCCIVAGACSRVVIPVKAPVPSDLRFETSTSPVRVRLAFADERSAEDKAAGLAKPLVKYGDAALDPVKFLGEHVQRELVARGIPVESDANHALSVRVKKAWVEIHMAHVHAPYTTLTLITADVDTSGGPRRMAAFVRRAKTAFGGEEKLYQACYDDALSVATKEIAAKLNRAFFKQRISDQDVDTLVTRIGRDGTRNPLTWLDVYQLGFGNNPRAVPALIALTKHEQEYVRLAAISSLGTIGATDQLNLLVSLSKSGAWQDRAMALKSIGDLGTAEAQAFIKTEHDLNQIRGGDEPKLLGMVMALYLQSAGQSQATPEGR